MLSDFVEILDIFKGLFKVEDAKGNIKYQAIFAGCQNELSPFLIKKMICMEKYT